MFSFYAVNLRSFNNKKITVQDILFKNNIDFAVLSEINCQSVPILKNYKQFVVYSKRRFHGVSVCVKSSLVKHCIRIPHPVDNQFEIVHIRINDTSVPTNLLGVYLDVESRSNVDAVKEGWFKLLNIANEVLVRGEAIILMGDLNRPLYSEKVSPGTKLLLDWIKEDTVEILNDNTPTRIDPANGKGSILDLAIVSKNIVNNVEKLYVDSGLSYTPFSMTKVKDKIIKKYTDHRALILQITLPLLQTKVAPKKVPVIDLKNDSKWDNYPSISDKYAESMIEIIENNEDVDVINRKLKINNTLLQIECFGLKWVSKNSKKQRKRDYKELNELYKEQMDDLNELIDKGVSGKDLMNKI